MFRVYDTHKKEWINNNVYLSKNNDLFIIKHSIFNGAKLELLSSDRYIYQKNINLYDKNDTMIYEGDYLKCQVSDDRLVDGVVVYADDISGYVVLCDKSSEWFSLGNKVSKYVEVIGNVFDGC